MRASLVVAAALALSTQLASAKPAKRKWDPQRTEDLHELGQLLKRHTAYLEVKVRRDRNQPLAEHERTGFGVVVEENLIATNYFVVERAERITVIGPKRRAPGKVVLADVDRRVALIRTETTLAALGLHPAKVLAKRARKQDADVFALVSTLESSGVVHGVITDGGGALELQGHPRTTLELHFSMPVYDAELRLVGYARTVSWDPDKKLLVPPEMITAARTATAAAAKKSAQRTDTRPWWGK